MSSILHGFAQSNTIVGSDIDAFETLAGKKMSIVSIGTWWWGGGGVYPGTGAYAPFPSDKAALAHSRGAHFFWDWIPGDGTDNVGMNLRSIYQTHAHDAYLDSVADAIIALNYPIFVRLAAEMNGSWRPTYWEGGPNNLGMGSGDFIAMWRYVVDRMRRRGATNITWVWCPNVMSTSNLYSTYQPLSQLYPGDNYVDWKGLDGYNFGIDGWQTFQQVFAGGTGSWYQDSLANIIGVGNSHKPILINETGCGDHDETNTVNGAKKAQWWTDALAYIATRPEIKGLIFQHYNDGSWNFRLDYPLSGAGSGQPAAAYSAQLGIGGAKYITGGKFTLPTGMKTIQPYEEAAQTDPLASAISFISNLQALWVAGEISGDLADTSGNTRTLTAHGAPAYNQASVVPSSRTGSIGFPGASTTWFETPDIPQWSIRTGANKFTVGLCIQLPNLAPGAGNNYMFFGNGNGSGIYGWAFRVNQYSQVEFIVWDGTGGTVSTVGKAPTGYVAGQRLIIIATYNGDRPGTAGISAADSNGRLYMGYVSGGYQIAGPSYDFSKNYVDVAAALQLGRIGTLWPLPATSKVQYGFIVSDEISSVSVQELLTAYQANPWLTGSQPNATGAITYRKSTSRTPAGSEPYPTGVAPRGLTHYHKALAGTEGLTSGFVVRAAAHARSLAGSEPAATGQVANPRTPLLVGSQPYPVGGLADVTVLRAMNWGARMQTWLPEMWYARATRVLAILQSEGSTFDTATTDIDQVRYARLPQTAPGWGIERLESEAGLPSRPELSLEDRRARTLAHFRGIGSTLYRLKAISQAWDYGNVAIVADPETYMLYITFIDTRGVPLAIEDHQAEMRTNVLAHLGITWNYTYLVWGDPKRLGITWGQLKSAGRTWGQLKTMKPEALP